ncbi:hypothetical protein PR048_018303 [Dryococelus australis]|uniref:Uncharacterized protein n=1 Tax=Dryococelus australis TaxID=614101 RepID=A0ABQ9HBW4_9NEOP|nr:hypothetical protein PR048_018303 [Dryococelus australis]
MKGRGKREIPDKTHRPTASSGTISTCESPVSRTGIEPGSPRWEASVLTAQPPSRPDINQRCTDFEFSVARTTPAKTLYLANCNKLECAI